LSDPVAYGLVTSLARPGGNITGVVADPGIQIQGKYVEVLRETLGGRLSRLGFLISRVTWDQRGPIVIATQEAAEKIGVRVFWRPTRKF
jgi:putative tryptophan/tyrosine transport system substrate-binding protein